MSQKYVFISYSSQNQSSANELNKKLEQEGISCWMAPHSIPAGSNYLKEIPSAISNCSALVLILSKESQESEWVSSEIETAKKYKKEIIPFHIDGCELNESFDFILTHNQRINAYGRRSEAYDKLIARIYELWNEKPAIITPPQKKPSIAKFLLLPAMIIAVIVLLVIPKGNQHEHVWEPATCISPKTCIVCGETSGNVAEHMWKSETCTSPKTCSFCGATDGFSLGHQWIEASYDEPKTCSVCGQTEGNPILDIVAGDTITMGNYGNEEIVWVVL